MAVAARRADGCQETVRQIEAAGGQAGFTVLDVTEAEAVEGWVRDTAERFGRIDWLVNNAGMNGRSARLEDQSTAEFEEVVRDQPDVDVLRGPCGDPDHARARAAGRS